MTFPEVRMVYCKTGRPEIANDVMGVHQTDVWTMLKPQAEWPAGMTRDGLIEAMDKKLSENVPGVKFGFSQPIEMRVNELVAGVKSDVAALIYGPDLDVLRQLAGRGRARLGQDPGGPGHQVAHRRAAADAPGVGPPRPARPVRDQGQRRARRRRVAGGDDGGERPRRAKAVGDPGPPPRSLAERPGADRRHPRGRPPGAPDPPPRPRRDRRRGRAERGRARERPAPVGGRLQRPGARPRRLRRRRPGHHHPRGPPPARLPAQVGRPVRAPANRDQSPPDRRADLAPVDLPAPLHHLRLGPARRLDLPGRADRRHRRDLRPRRPRPALLDLRRRRLHRPLRRRRPERPGLGQRGGGPPRRRDGGPRRRPSRPPCSASGRSS